MVCTNALNNFKTKSVTVSVENNKYKGTLYYVVLHCDSEYLLSHVFSENAENIADIFCAFFELLWTVSLCPECFAIVTAPDTLCNECYPMRIMHQYGVAHQHSPSVPTCSICFDQVYHSKLHCGHYVHKTCFVKMNPEKSFTYDMEIKCPICRAPMTSQDRYEFFLWYG